MRKTAVIAVLLGLGACAVVEKSGDEITIEHAANQIIAARMTADDHCQTRGRAAQLVMTSPRESSLLFLQSSVSVFRCEAPKPTK